MNKEQEIKKIEEILGDCNKNICRIENTCEHCKAKILYNAGYRKQSEVAKEIFNNLSNDKFIRDNNFGFCDLKEYAKEYGVDL